VVQQNRQQVQLKAPEWFQYDAVAQRYEAMFEMLDWTVVAEKDDRVAQRGRLPHPESAYIKALLVMIEEKHDYVTDMHDYLREHPALVWVLGFRLKPEAASPYGFDIAQSLPSPGHLRRKLRSIAAADLTGLLAGSVQALREVIPDLGQQVILDVKHIYANVKENNPRAYVKDRYDPSQQPSGDLDCRLGVKQRDNRLDNTGKSRTEAEYLWGYGSGVAVSKTPDKQVVVLAEYTQPFNQNDVTYALPLLNRAMMNLGFAPRTLIADAAFDAWYVYQWVVELGGRAAVALNQRGNSATRLGPHDYPLCRCNGQEMQPKSCWIEDTHRLQRFVCPDCQTVRKMNIEPGNIFRWRIDRQSDLFKQLYKQRTAIERLNSRAEALKIDQPRQRTARAVARRNTLIYIVLNLRLLRRYYQRQPCPQLLDKAA
jgi:hypothetical protein